jgi:eukaryotic-like serine/threonine-protein kinase
MILAQRMEEFIRQRIGQTLGERWVLQSVLGVGGMAAVYAAKDFAGNEAAVKVLHPEIGRRAELRDRFMREGSVANRIQHPGAVRVLEHGAVDEWSVFLVMERLQGESLGDRVARDGSLPLPDLLDVLEQVLDVLAVAHDAGIVHRDLKPDNLFITESGVVKVLDFGVARVLEAAPDDVRTRTGMAMGTLPYMAPEQALGKRSEIDGRVDIFALGATAFRILTKRRIHEADSEAGMLLAMATKAAPPLRSVAADVPENVAAIVDLALAFSRDARYPDARTMQEDLRAVQRADSPPFAGARLRARDEATRQGIHVPALALRTPTVVAPRSKPAATAVPLALPASKPTPGVVASRSGPVVAAVTPPPAPAPWHVTAEGEPSTLPRVEVTPLGASPASATPPPSLPLWVVGAGAFGCLLLGALLWLLWPSSQPEAAEAETEPTGTNMDVARAMEAEEKLDVQEPGEGVEAARERTREQDEQAREQQKGVDELWREPGKKKGGRGHGRNKR